MVAELFPTLTAPASPAEEFPVKKLSVIVEPAPRNAAPPEPFTFVVMLPTNTLRTIEIFPPRRAPPGPLALFFVNVLSVTEPLPLRAPPEEALLLVNVLFETTSAP